MMMNMLDAYEESLESEKNSNSKRSSLAPGEPGENEDYTTDALVKRNSAASATSSVSGNAKPEKDLCLLYAENEAFKNANTNSESVKRLRSFMENTPEPFSRPFNTEQSKWAGKPQGCCVLS
jgi:hypothetical protein